MFKRINSTTSPTRKLKVNFNDFPGGARSFELLTRFCYNNGTITLTPYNITSQYLAAQYMEMNQIGVDNLFQQTNNYLKQIDTWSWNELIFALKQFQKISSHGISTNFVHKYIESLVSRIASGNETCCSVSSSSSDSSVNRFSSDTKSSDSSKNIVLRLNWWFQDVSFLNPELLQILVKLMIVQKLDNVIVSKFLFFYHRSKITSSISDQKNKITSSVIELLHLLKSNVISYKSLTTLLSVSSNLNLSFNAKLVSMIGSRLDEATLDDLLIRCPNGMKYSYNVNLVLRLVKTFVRGCCDDNKFKNRLRNVARVMDLYLLEVAPDPFLKPCKMFALVIALPDFSRVCYDGVYRAVDLYIQVRCHR